MSKNIKNQSFDITQAKRNINQKQNPKCIWFEGLSGSGKSTLINSLEVYLNSNGYYTYSLDGDNLRNGLNSDLGFSKQDRIENIRRASEVAGLMVEAGLIVLAGFITPFEIQRKELRKNFRKGQFVEVFISTPLEICEKRDTKGLYKKARRGEISAFTGIDSPFEKPKNADIEVNTVNLSIEDSVKLLVKELNL